MPFRILQRLGGGKKRGPDAPRSGDAERSRDARALQLCKLLSVDHEPPLEDRDLDAAWKLLEDDMALVPAGQVQLVSTAPPPLMFEDGEEVGFDDTEFFIHPVGAVYIDRFAVTNSDFAEFVAADGYADSEYWPRDILPFALQFVDQTGVPAPRFWSHGRPPQGLEDHPVVGVSWLEADAYAQWAGKRLVSPAEWQRAATWYSESQGGAESRYPWGNSFGPLKANTAGGSQGTTVPVDCYHEGCTPNGIYQLIGNVWEWVAARFDCGGDRDGITYIFQQAMGEIRGGAFDTYFASQGTAQFRSGQPLLYRGSNVGFRCCVSVEQLCSPPIHPSLCEA